MNLTTKRMNGHRVDLFVDGAKAGEVFRRTKDRFPVRRPGGTPKYLLSLHGIYWRLGEPTVRGGSSTKGFRRLGDAVAAATTTLERLAPRR